MQDDVTNPEAPRISSPQEERGRRNPVVIGVIVGGAIVVLAAVVFVALALLDFGKTAEFPSLASQPDDSLKGTVAYLDWNYPGCVRVVAAAGTPMETFGCDGGSSLSWLEDGRLRILGYDDSDEGGSSGFAWGKVVDVGTGAVEEIPVAELPAEMPEAPDPTVGPNGERLTVTNDDGAVELVLEDGSGSRVLMTAEGGSQYSVGVQGWSPDGQWVLLSDAAARLLLVTVEEPSETRVLAEEFQDQAVITGADAMGG